ncbi:MAG: hypothetical protein L6Q78_11120 [Bacteroidia bacterium]|nr:hypothetical protein [Bacteroidia bacterium]
MTANEFITKYGFLIPIKLENGMYSFHGWFDQVEILICDITLEMALQQADEQLIGRRKDLSHG